MTNAKARFNNSLRPRKPEGSLGRTAQDVHLDSHTAPELCPRNLAVEPLYTPAILSTGRVLSGRGGWLGGGWAGRGRRVVGRDRWGAEGGRVKECGRKRWV